MEALLIIAVVLLYTAQSLFCRMYTDRYPGKAQMASPVFTVISGFLIAAITFGFAGFSFSAHGMTLLLGVCNALVLFGYNFFIIRASQLGSYAIMMVFSVAGGIILPAIIAAIAFGDEISTPQILSMIAIFAAVYMVSYKKNDGGQSGGRAKFLLVCTGLAICNGIYGALLDVQGRLTGPGEKEEMLMLTFCGAAIASLIPILLSEKRDSLRAFRQTRTSLLFLLTCAMAAAGAANLLVFILRLVSPALLYTFDNAGVLLLSVLASCVLFKEKLTLLNAIGCGIMCAGLVCLSLF